ncbi:class I SAM-dependent methyltransferase [Rhizobium sp. PP-CC-3G-465]|uniref:class I SAM-dependent methyltransferase n=1 Tax=Rhizobium sp. PP-CC-3G-465 TaxID=2135648 RepID=UPI00104AFAFF|nr:16S rRNA m(2)G 1207 methyltransferase [Rhizobium sp. PP-CC-3G-465]
MTSDKVKTLFHPFDSGVLSPPGEGERVLFLAAETGYRLPEGFDAEIVCVQPNRPAYRALVSAGATVTPFVEGDDYAATLILCGKHRGENENRIAEALKRTRIGGVIVVAGTKEDGIQSLRKRIGALEWGGDSMPKYHGVAFWFARPEDPAAEIERFASSPVRVEGRFDAAPGMFSHDRIDGGSELLASRLPMDFSGHAADFGAGWGYLSVMLAERAPGVKGIDLFEADYHALEAARGNLKANAPKVPTRFHWQDLTQEVPRDHYDLVIMNPPFHETQAADPALGAAMIAMAAKSLKAGGRLMLVANRGLPYEPTMNATFKEWGETCRNARFKILWGRK